MKNTPHIIRIRPISSVDTVSSKTFICPVGGNELRVFASVFTCRVELDGVWLEGVVGFIILMIYNQND